jgi:hypothetical protein
LNGEGPETRREPSIEDVFVLLENELLSGEFGFSALTSFFFGSSSNPVFSRETL